MFFVPPFLSSLQHCEYRVAASYYCVWNTRYIRKYVSNGIKINFFQFQFMFYYIYGFLFLVSTVVFHAHRCCSPFGQQTSHTTWNSSRALTQIKIFVSSVSASQLTYSQDKSVSSEVFGFTVVESSNINWSVEGKAKKLDVFTPHIIKKKKRRNTGRDSYLI